VQTRAGADSGVGTGERRVAKVGRLGGVTTHLETDLLEAQTACYRVRATIQAQAITSVPSNTACATATTVIIVAPPTGLTVTNPPAVPQ